MFEAEASLILFVELSEQDLTIKFLKFAILSQNFLLLLPVSLLFLLFFLFGHVADVGRFRNYHFNSFYKIIY